jgi:membrane protein implicated in regulation of membrane protease activity
MDAWLSWIGTAGLLGVAEMLTMGLFLAPFALGALHAGALAATGTGFSLSVAAFALISLALLFTVRPLVLAQWRAPVGIRTGTAALIGSRALVVERIAFPPAGRAGRKWKVPEPRGGPSGRDDGPFGQAA